jgi:hypothetical protein
MTNEEKKAKAKAKPEEKAEVDILIAEAKRLGLKIPKISIAGFKSKKPGDIEKEKARVKKQLVHLLQHAIANAKANAKLKPIDKRRALLRSRFKAVKARDRAHTYSDKNIKAWLEELKMINNNPKSWNKLTKNGTVPFVPGNRKKKTARDILDGMNLEEEDNTEE